MERKRRVQPICRGVGLIQTRRSHSITPLCIEYLNRFTVLAAVRTPSAFWPRKERSWSSTARDPTPCGGWRQQQTAGAPRAYAPSTATRPAKFGCTDLTMVSKQAKPHPPLLVSPYRRLRCPPPSTPTCSTVLSHSLLTPAPACPHTHTHHHHRRHHHHHHHHTNTRVFSTPVSSLSLSPAPYYSHFLPLALACLFLSLCVYV